MQEAATTPRVGGTKGRGQSNENLEAWGRCCKTETQTSGMGTPPRAGLTVLRGEVMDFGKELELMKSTTVPGGVTDRRVGKSLALFLLPFSPLPPSSPLQRPLLVGSNKEPARKAEMY